MDQNTEMATSTFYDDYVPLCYAEGLVRSLVVKVGSGDPHGSLWEFQGVPSLGTKWTLTCM